MPDLRDINGVVALEMTRADQEIHKGSRQAVVWGCLLSWSGSSMEEMAERIVDTLDALEVQDLTMAMIVTGELCAEVEGPQLAFVNNRPQRDEQSIVDDHVNHVNRPVLVTEQKAGA